MQTVRLHPTVSVSGLVLHAVSIDGIFHFNNQKNFCPEFRYLRLAVYKVIFQ